MNILMLIDRLDVGGAETHLITLARAIAKEGDRVTVLSGGGVLEEALRRANIPCLHFPAPIHTARGLWRALRFLRALTRQQRFDVLHAHTRRTALLLRLLPRLCLPRKRIPAVPAAYRRRGWLRAHAPLRVVTAHAVFTPRYRRMSYWGECTIAVSADIAAHLHCVFGQPGAHVIPNGVPLAQAAAQNADKNAFSVVFASRLDADCSLVAAQLLQIAPTLAARCEAVGRRLRLTILGGGDCYAALCRTAAALKAAHPQLCIEMTGRVSDPMPYYRQAQVFVGVSRAALEAIGQGCRVVLAGNEGFGGCLCAENFAQMAHSNLCARGMPQPREDALLDALCALLSEDEATFAQRTQAVCALVRAQYGEAQMARATVCLYARALAKKRRLRLLCVGYFGYGNLGDQAILRMLARRFDGACAPTSLADTPWYTVDVDAVAAQGRIFRAPRHLGVFRARRVLPVGADGFFPQNYTRYCVANAAPRPMQQPRDRSKHLPSHTVPPRLQLCVLCGGAQKDGATRPRHEGMDALSRRHPWRLLAALCRADALLLGGGELLQNVSRHGTLSLLYYLLLPGLGRLLGCPFSLRSGGVGRLRGAPLRWLTGAVMRRAAGITLREEASLRRLGSCGVPRERMALLEDGVVAWCARRRWVRVRYPAHWQDGFVCACPRASDGATLAELQSRAAAIYPTLPRVWLAIGGEADEVICRRLWAQQGGSVLSLADERAAYALLRQARALLSMRLHALLLAQQEVACIPIACDKTCDKLAAADAMRQCGKWTAF